MNSSIDTVRAGVLFLPLRISLHDLPVEITLVTDRKRWNERTNEMFYSVRPLPL